MMRDRINGSHLKRKHGISLEEYVALFPDSDVGRYRVNSWSCKICGYFLTSGVSESIRYHLRDHNLTVDEYNIEYNKKYCLCGCEQLAEYSYKKHCYNDYVKGHCQIWNKGLTKETDNRIFETFSKKFLWTQIDNDQNRIIRKIAQENSLKTYRSGNAKIEQRSENYKKTMLEKYGVDNYFKTDQFKICNIQHNLEKYGVPNQMQRTEIFLKSNKNSKRFKDYVESNGKVRQIQGYEDMALDVLLQQFQSDDIVDSKSEMPRFIYRISGVLKRYYPDFLIRSINKIIEVKSWWTYENEEYKDEKKQCVLDSGFDYEYWIFDDRKSRRLTIIK